MKYDLNDSALLPLLFEGDFGLERETLRVDGSGRLAQTPHPFGDDPNLSRDFCENQLEIITPVADSPAGAAELLGSLHRRAAEKLLSLGESLWPFSNPPGFESEDDIPIARFDGMLKNKQVYRQFLAKKYGKKKMLYSGIHLNFSFPDKLIEKLAAGDDLTEFKNRLYLTLASRLTEYSWLIVLLNAASPLADEKNFPDYSSYASLRCSSAGYWNDFVPVLDYSSLYAYCLSIQQLVNDGRLVSPSELYYPIRLKPRGENSLEALLTGGCDHIELRMYDINPLAPYGIFTHDIEFAQLLMIYLLSLDLPEPDEQRQLSAITNIKRAALYDRDDLKLNIGACAVDAKQAAGAILDDMQRFFDSLGADPEKTKTIALQEEKLKPHQSYAEQIRERFGEDGFKNAAEFSRQFTFGK